MPHSFLDQLVHDPDMLRIGCSTKEPEPPQHGAPSFQAGVRSIRDVSEKACE